MNEQSGNAGQLPADMDKSQQAVPDVVVDAAGVAFNSVNNMSWDEASMRAALVAIGYNSLRRDAEYFRWVSANPEHPSMPYYDTGRWWVPYEVSNAGGFGGGVGATSFDSLAAAIAKAKA